MGNIVFREKLSSPRKKIYYPRGTLGISVYHQKIGSLVRTQNSNHQNPNLFISTPNLACSATSTMNLDKEIFDDGKKVPVPPPRKHKRSTMKKSATLPVSTTSFSRDNEKSEKIIKNGFKDIFGNENTTKSSSTTFNRSESCESESKKSKIGHRRIDRILSESSDPGQSRKNSEDSTISTSDLSNDKKLFFLMNMFHDEINKSDERRFHKTDIIVDEYSVISKRKHRKSSNDDPSIQSLAKPATSDAPKKPDRDFSKYQKPSENDPSFNAVKIGKENIKLSIDDVSTLKIDASHQQKSSANNLTPPVMENNAKSMTTKHNRPPPLNITITKPVDEGRNLNRSDVPQTAPILTQVIADEMMKKAYGLNNYYPEDFTLHNLDDGSNLVAPTSKLAVRKISVGRKISSCSTPSIDSVNEELLTVQNPANTPTTPPLKSPTFMGSKNAAMSDFLEEVFNQNPKMMDEFQSYLEVSVDKNPVVNVANEKAFVEEKGIQIMNDEDKMQKSKEVEDEKFIMDDEENSSSSDLADSDEQQETITEIAMIPRNKFPKYHSARRESIEDVDNWFTRHLDIDDKKSDYENNIPDSSPSNTTYDTHKIFPFGKAITDVGRRASISDEFFSDLPPVFCNNEEAIEEE